MPYCSWCLKDVQATLAVKATFGRDLLRCSSCYHTLVRCRACENYACWDSFTIVTPQGKRKYIKQHDQFCGEHRHVVRNFERLHDRLKSPADYRTVYDFRAANLVKTSKQALFALGGVAIAGPLAWAAGPAIGGALGSAGGLSGVAATNAGLATIGGGSLAAGGLGMAGGLAIITATGGAVGGSLGAYIAGQYLDDVEGFDIYRVRSGRKPAIITVNGFLSQQGEAHEGWMPGIDAEFPDREWYHVEWEAKRLANLGAYCATGGGVETLRKMLEKAAKRATKQAATKITGLANVVQLVALSRNPWHVAFIKSEKTGVILADILRRCDRRQFILVGHSLGCRVIYSCLQTLATTKSKKVAGCYLFGGAVHNSHSNWQVAACALARDGRIHNYWSERDMVLRYLYSVGTFFKSHPIGRNPIQSFNRVSNYNLSNLNVRHMNYKPKLPDIFAFQMREDRNIG